MCKRNREQGSNRCPASRRLRRFVCSKCTGAPRLGRWGERAEIARMDAIMGRVVKRRGEGASHEASGAGGQRDE